MTASNAAVRGAIAPGVGCPNAPAKPAGLARLLEAIGEASLTLIVGFGPPPPALKPAEIIRSALAPLLQEPCDLVAFSGGPDTAVVVVTPRSGDPFDPILTQGIVDRLHAALQVACAPAPIRITPLAFVTPVGAREENLAFLEELLDTIVNRRLSVQFMPIVNLNAGAVYGYEALIRAPQGGVLNRMGLMFATADRARLVSWLDMACQEQCFQEAAAAGAREHLFFNMDAEGLVHLQMSERCLADRAREMGISPGRVVMEITERQAVEDYPRLSAYIEEVRAQGFKIAIDDAGSGYNSLQAIAEIRPEFVKIGRPLIRNIETNGARRALIRCLSEYTMQIGTSLIAEGIETQDELSAVMDLGVTYGQGYLLGRPDDRFRNVRRAVRDLLEELADRRRRRTSARSYAVADAATAGLTLEAGSALGQVVRQLSRNPDNATVVLLEEDRPVALVTRADLERTLVEGSATLDGPIPEMLKRKPSLIDADAPIEEAAMMAAHRPTARASDDLILVRNGQFAGLISAQGLLEAVTTLRIRQSARRNAISGLPGRVLLEEALAARVAAHMPTALLQFRLSGLADLNAAEGYQRGDELLRAVAGALEELRTNPAGADAVAAHAHGSLFFVLLHPGKAGAFAEEARARFARIAAPILAATPAGERPPRLALLATGVLVPHDRPMTLPQLKQALQRTRQQAPPHAPIALDPALAAAPRD